MFLPSRVCSSTSSLKPEPSHSSHSVSTVCVNPRLVMMTPRPRHAGQAPSELALKSAGFTPLAFANAVRIASRMPV
ncbi:hypothetical protein D3C87_2019590 [compost metagenome]